jgi:hypothetical protein
MPGVLILQIRPPFSIASSTRLSLPAASWYGCAESEVPPAANRLSVAAEFARKSR